MASPTITTIAIGAHHWLDSAPAINLGGNEWISRLQPIAIGINPRIVVIAVKRTGLNLSFPACIAASSEFRLLFFCSWIAKSRRIIALFTTTPARLIIPNPVIIMLNLMWNTSKPKNTPIMENTTEENIINGRRIELNWRTRIIKINPDAIKKDFRRKEKFSS